MAEAHKLPGPLNVFEAVSIAADIVPSPAPPGGFAVFLAEPPCIVCVNACPKQSATRSVRVRNLLAGF